MLSGNSKGVVSVFACLIKESLSSAKVGEAVQQALYYSRSSIYNWPEDRKCDKKISPRQISVLSYMKTFKEIGLSQRGGR